MSGFYANPDLHSARRLVEACWFEKECGSFSRTEALLKACPITITTGARPMTTITTRHDHDGRDHDGRDSRTAIKIGEVWWRVQDFPAPPALFLRRIRLPPRFSAGFSRGPMRASNEHFNGLSCRLPHRRWRSRPCSGQSPSRVEPTRESLRSRRVKETRRPGGGFCLQTISPRLFCRGAICTRQ